MNLNELERRLIEVARRNPPSDRVPHAFEQRIMARLKDAPQHDLSALWAQALWRGALSCVAATTLLGAWLLLTTPVVNEDLSGQIESAVLAAVDQEGDLLW